MKVEWAIIHTIFINAKDSNKLIRYFAYYHQIPNDIVSVIEAEQYPLWDQISDENVNEIEPQSDQGGCGSAIDNDSENHVTIAIPRNDESSKFDLEAYDLNSEWSNSYSSE